MARYIVIPIYTDFRWDRNWIRVRPLLKHIHRQGHVLKIEFKFKDIHKLELEYMYINNNYKVIHVNSDMMKYKVHPYFQRSVYKFQTILKLCTLKYQY